MLSVQPLIRTPYLPTSLKAIVIVTASPGAAYAPVLCHRVTFGSIVTVFDTRGASSGTSPKTPSAVRCFVTSSGARPVRIDCSRFSSALSQAAETGVAGVGTIASMAAQKPTSSRFRSGSSAVRWS